MRWLASVTASLGFGALVGLYFLFIVKLDDPEVTPRIALFTGAVGAVLAAAALAAGSRRRSRAVRVGYCSAIAAAWLSLSVFVGWGLSGVDGYGPFLGVLVLSGLGIGLPALGLLAITLRYSLQRRREAVARKSRPKDRLARPRKRPRRRR
jgi:hypothetical protein